MRDRGLSPLMLVVVAGAALAEGPAQAGSADVLGCLDIRDDQARLACFDRTAPSLRTAVPAASAEATVSTVLEPPRDPVREFGRERTESGRREVEAQQVDAIQAAVRTVRQLQPGRYILSLDNGQVWYVKDAGSRRIEKGDLVEIKRAIMDGYAMVVNATGRIIRVERVD